MDTKHSRFLALAELLLDEINAANELPATVENVAELLDRMIRTIDAYRATGGDVADLIASSGAGSKLDDVRQFLNPADDLGDVLNAG